MTDKLLDRIDAFVAGMLDEAEGHCGKPAADDTSDPEGVPVPQQRSPLVERIALLKAATAYIELRNRLKPDGPADKPKGNTPTIVGMADTLRERERGRRR